MLVTLSFGLGTGPATAQLREPVLVDGGQIAGTTGLDPKVRAFKGVPFAAPPLGGNRWRPPQPVVRWDGIREADTIAPKCPQLETPPDAIYYSHPEPQSEDCLYLNIWTAAGNAEARLPVMVWIYGGGYRAGSTGLRMYDGTSLAQRGAVFVSIAYRVGPLGFLAHPLLSSESPQRVSGNYGLLDQIAALDWVRRNIAAFGGDPDNITVFGQSAGSLSVSYLAASPLATGLFHRAIGQTGAGFGLLTPASLAEAEGEGAAFMHRVGATSVAEMRALDATALVEAAGPASGAFEPNVDGWLLPASPAAIYTTGRQNDVPLLIGSNDEESRNIPGITADGWVEELERRYGSADAAALLRLHPADTDASARLSARRLTTIELGDLSMQSWAQAQLTTGTQPVYRYYFTRKAPVPSGRLREQRDTPNLGAFHGSEIVYTLANLQARDWPWTDADRALSDTLASYWINFARTGDPNGEGLPHWPHLAETPGTVMELGDEAAPVPAPHQETLTILQRHFRSSGDE